MKFILIDHSLTGVGGHHFEYAMHILSAAQRAGFDVVLAANCRLRDRTGMPAHWPVHSLFRFDVYCKHAVSGGHRRRTGRGTGGAAAAGGAKVSTWPARLIEPIYRFCDRGRQLLRQIDRRRRCRHFTRACHDLFQRLPLQAGDQVFVPTLSEIDLLGLVAYLQAAPQSQLAQWHLQFHFDLFDGREPDYVAESDRIFALRQLFEETLAGARNHRLHFYSTTPQLAAQYNLLKVADFRTLAYPVNPAFPAYRRHKSQRPLRITCAGGMREEKGREHLATLVRSLWDDALANNNAQLLVQTNRTRFQRLRSEIMAPAAKSGMTPYGQFCRRVVQVRHPLRMDQYVDLIGKTDIGLFLYDSNRYYARCSGILVEMLSAGVPVIVPAGCWLADQIAESIYEHLDRLPQHLPTVQNVGEHDFSWQSPIANAAAPPGKCMLTFGDRDAAICAEAVIPAGATDLLVNLHWPVPKPGTYVRLQAEQFDADGKQLDDFVSIAGQRLLGQAVPLLVHLKQHAVRVRLTLQNAYGKSPITVTDVQLTFLCAAAAPKGHCPAGAVGLIAAAPEYVGPLVHEMIDHFEHYKETAARFSRPWSYAHAPERTVETLMAHAQISSPSGIERDAA